MEKYINKIKKKIKKIGKKKLIIIIISILLILLATIFIYRYVENKVFKNKVQNKEITSMSDFESVREVVTYMGCDYIKEEKNKSNDYLEDIYLRFNKELYDGDNSNQIFFENLSGYIAYVLNYSNFRMIDNSKKILIEVVCDKENKDIKEMIVNGNSNYYADENSRRGLRKFKEIKETNLEINSNILNNLIQSEWVEAKVNLGTKDSYFDKYDIYFDEGLEVRKIGRKVFNIVFNDKYLNSIVNNLKVGQSFEDIKETLGDPTFEQEDIIGYKSKDIYVFFEEDEISIYPVDDTNSDEFVNLIENMDNEKDISKILNKLTDIWPDYDEYDISDNQFSITYSLKGVKLQYNVTAQQGFTLYNNYVGNIKDDRTIKNVREEDIPKYVYIDTENNLVFIKEQARKSMQQEEKYRCASQVEDEENNLNIISNQFDYYIEFGENVDKIKFFSKENNNPKTELEVNLNSYMWLDDNYFLYSVKNKGIYLFDVKNRKTRTLVEGTQEYTFKEYNSNVLKYDNNSISLK